MWPFKKTARQRRLEVRKPPRTTQSLWVRFRRAGGIGAAVAAGTLYLAALAMDLSPVQPFDYRRGQYLEDDVRARVAFRIPIPDLIDKAKAKAREATPAVFQFDDALIQDLAAALKRLPRRAAAETQPADANQPAIWQTLADDPNAVKAYQQQVSRMLEDLPAITIVRLKDPQEHKKLYRWPEDALLYGPKGKVAKDVNELLDVQRDAERIATEANRLASALPEPQRKAVAGELLAALATRGVYRYDAEATQTLMDAAAAAVTAHPPEEAHRRYDVGERIAARSRQKNALGEHVIALGAKDPDVLRVLQYEHEAFCAAEAAQPVRFWGRIAGRAAILAVAFALLAIYVTRYQRRVMTETRRMIGLLIVLLAMLLLSKVLVAVVGLNPHVAVLGVSMTGAVLVISWNERFALAIGALMAMVVVLQLRAGMGLFLVLLAALASMIFQLDEIRTRTKLIRAAGVSGGIVFLAVWITGLAGAVPWSFALTDAFWAAGCALGAGFVVQGILPLIERVFHVATSLTLLEWCDASKPLLRRLAMEAPGTYNHSLQLGAMCEAAAEAVGARGLVARVGAYYHDIGKINKPDYFIENQGAGDSKHDKLSPAISLLIIIAHVKDGIEMAREYGVPKVLHEFIATHHGTTLVQYFYQAATEQRKSDTDRAPDEMEFRYPGPKPHSKEPAILMLADAAESSVRSMSEPTPGRIENQVHAMVTRRLMDGQLDECELTLNQVHQIEASLVKSLCSMYHARIAYPTPAGQQPSAGEREANQAARANGPAKPHADNGEQANGETKPSPK